MFIIENFWELGHSPNCIWVKLDFEKSETNELEINVVNNFSINNEQSGLIFKNENLISDYISDNTKTFDICKAVEMFRNIKMISKGNDFSFIGGYKPVYFLFK